VTAGRWLAVAVVGGAVLFALFGGEYGIHDLRTLREAVAEEEAAIAELEAAIDSLRSELKALETDPEVLERVARERYGMIRPGEHLYRIERVP
jgi:cell division protein FtsB